MDEKDLEIQELRRKLDRVKRERDAAVSDLTKMAHILRVCQFCKHGERNSKTCKAVRAKNNVTCFEWRGVKEATE